MLLFASSTHATISFEENGQDLVSIHGNLGQDVALGDMDSDGDLDALVAQGSGSQYNILWLNDGTGQFTESPNVVGNRDSRAVAVGDLDGDGDLDAWFANGASGIPVNADDQVWINQGGLQGGIPGEFSLGATIADDITVSVALGDLDGDGDRDAAVMGATPRVWWNDGTGQFPTYTDLNRNGNGHIALADLDGDQDLDILFGGTGIASSSNPIFLNDGPGTQTFTEGPTLDITGGITIGAAIASLDEDTNLDVFMTSSSGTRVWWNNGANSFSEAQLLANESAGDVALADLDGDGDQDAFVTHRSSPDFANRVWINNGDRTFTLDANMLGDAVSDAVALGDLDGDGDVDAFVANRGAAHEVWLNTTVPPQPYSPAFSLLLFQTLEQLLEQTEAGKQLADLYWTHSSEHILFDNPDLILEMLGVFEEFQPGVAQLLGASGGNFQITQGMIDRVNAVADQVLLSASPELSQAIEDKRVAFNGLQDFVGKDFTQWAEMLGVAVPSEPFILVSSPRRENGKFTVEANTVAGQTLSLWRNVTLLPGDWQPVLDAEVNEHTYSATFTDPAPPSGQSFYQVRATAPLGFIQDPFGLEPSSSARAAVRIQGETPFFSIHNVEVTEGPGTGLIHDNDGSTSGLVILDTEVVEGDSGTTDAVFRVGLNGANSSGILVDYATEGFSAVAGIDYVESSGTLTIPAGSISANLTVPIIGDALPEWPQRFFVRLSNARGADIQDDESVCTIIDDDDPEVITVCSDDVPKEGAEFASSITVDSDIIADNVSVRMQIDHANHSGFPAKVNLFLEKDSDRFPSELFPGGLTIPPGSSIGTTCSPVPDFAITDNAAERLKDHDGEAPYIGSWLNKYLIFSEIEGNNARGTYTLEKIRFNRIGNSITVRLNCWCLVITAPREGLRLEPARATLPVFDNISFDLEEDEDNTLGEPSGGHYVKAALNTSSGPAANVPVTFTVRDRGGEGDVLLTKVINTDQRGRAILHYLDWVPGPQTIEARAEVNDAIYTDIARVTFINPCAVTQTVQGTASAEATLKTLRAFRDSKLAASERGRQYSRLYYKFSSEAVRMMMLNPMMVLRSQKMIESYLPIVRDMVAGENVTLTEADLDEIDGFLNSFASKGSPELKQTIKGLCEDLRNPRVHREFGVTVTSGPRRAMAAHNQTMQIKQAGAADVTEPPVGDDVRSL